MLIRQHQGEFSEGLEVEGKKWQISLQEIHFKKDSLGNTEEV